MAQELWALAEDVGEQAAGEALEAAAVGGGHAVPALGGAKVEVVDLSGDVVGFRCFSRQGGGRGGEVSRKKEKRELVSTFFFLSLSLKKK